MDLKEKEKYVQLVGNASQAFSELESRVKAALPPKKADAQLFGSIIRTLDLLKSFPFIGKNVQRKLWPKEFKDLPNLFRMELAQFWRLLYYIVGDDTKIICMVFEICDHEKYDAIFGYRKK